LKKEINNLYPGGDCLFCGAENPIGLKLKFYLDEETNEVSTEYLPSRLYVGLGNILHGGIQTGLFDEIMGWTTHSLTGEWGVTSELQVKFLKPVYLGKQISVCCHIASRDGPKVHLEARIETLDGTVCSVATGTYYLLPQAKFHKLVQGDQDGGTPWVKQR
jgi:acyl-coenzyme A thioesterase PaaI-like protein